MLILDGQGSHLTYPIVSRATEENMPVVLLQTLDVGLFRSLKAKLSKVTDAVKLFKCNW